MAGCFRIEFGFSEVVRCGSEGGRRIAHGWTASEGQFSPDGQYIYHPPTGWEFDPNYEDITAGGTGEHGTCPKCMATLVHLRDQTVTDPCAGVSCPDVCVGVDKYDGVCRDGICVRGTLIETNSVHCGYTPEPTPDPTPTPSSDTYIIVALMLAGTYIILRR